ncbi:heparinase II/III domain-containing protein [Pontiella agarivorans]|uniref:Heparinase II/III family protein n=1 Tax=Pontiella agarivorans TaxID=3038953 RepID=A0ABU5MYY3_9BACT|nr:heparinase II/III family protein [Pontiella agarivorans]MDZ8119186.1 heparinase II/III family protein [Pontiella agarivorans]
MMKKNDIVLFIFAVGCMVYFNAKAAPDAVLPVLDNPMSVEYLQDHLSEDHPRLVYTPAIVAGLKAKLETDEVLQHVYQAVKRNAGQVLETPLLTRKMEGRRLLGTSREMLYRVNMLGAVWLMEKPPEMLARLNDELIAVCSFSNWNPKHYLDVAEMSLAVALALDWCGGDLPESTVALAKKALMEKGLDADGKGRARIVSSSNNWNQVCNGGMIAAAILLADDEPEFAADTIRRALEKMPNALVEYAPDGLYPEGSTYWAYGTGYSVITIAMLESAFGSDFGISAVPGFLESAVFRALCNAPSGMYYNFADCGERRSPNGDLILAWFAAKTANPDFFERDRFLRPADQMGKLDRHAGAALAWLSQGQKTTVGSLPTAWKGDGQNPIAVFSGGASDSRSYYFGGKGGRASISHGNMDAGSFVFELDGVRWVLDSGNQRYYDLEKTGFNLWGKEQDSERWTLLTKNNFGHSTLTVNDELFKVDGYAPLIDFKDGETPSAAFDLTAVYGKNVKRATRRFIQDGPASLVIEDRIAASEKTRRLTWQLITAAEVERMNGGAVLRQTGKMLHLEMLSHPAAELNVVSLDPPPLKLDRRIKGLKRVEIDVPVTAGTNEIIEFRVRLSGE